jgi:50S ribosomal protein L16 3-hydroxylase
MDINTPLTLLGGLTASQFMRKHWHKSLCWCARPSPASRPRFRVLACWPWRAKMGVESRLIQQLEGDKWKLSHGPLSRRSLPGLTKPGWTVLVQGGTCMTPRRMSCCSSSALCPRRASMI